MIFCLGIQRNPDELDLNAIVSSLKDAGNFEQQLTIFMNSVRPEFPAIIDKYKWVCYDLEKTLRNVFRNCKIHAFGSTITGLCFKDSDVDIYVELPDDTLKKYNSEQLLKTARRALFNNNRVFNDIVCIFKAKTPIVKCYHLPTRIHCDFNFKNMLGVCNSRLISYYLSLDHKLTEMMLILKFWAKIHEISGSHKFTNYALAMLLIFYLQHPPYNLPPVEVLQTNSTFYQEYWNGGFSPLYNFRSEELSNVSLIELLKGFFNFYMTFEFGLYVISPFVGRTILKIAFFEPEKLFDDFATYKAYLQKAPNPSPLLLESAMCIQDPFELSRNVGGIVHVRVLEWFIKHCKEAFQIISNSGENNFLYKLFTVSPKNFAITNELTTFDMRLVGNLRYIYDSMDAKEHNANTIRKCWLETLNMFLLSMLTHVLKLNVDIESSTASASKLQKIEGQKDVHDNNIVDSVVFHCTGKYIMWEQRKYWWKNFGSDLKLPPDSSSFDKEVALTNFVCDGNVKVLEDVIDFNLLITARTNPTLVEYQLKRIKGNKGTFHKLCVFFVTNFAAWFSTHLSEKSIKDKKSTQK